MCGKAYIHEAIFSKKTVVNALTNDWVDILEKNLKEINEGREPMAIEVIEA